jgi:hypothetical protein
MTFLAPAWLGFAAGAALAVVAIHLIAWRLPRAVILPTARFVPDEPARLAARTVRPSDLALLALRIAIIIAGGVAMARPTVHPSPRGAALVIALESSAAVGDAALLHDSVRAIPRRDRTIFVVFDTAARVFGVEDAAWNDIAGPRISSNASLTVGLLAAIREARRLTRDYESVDVVVASTFSRSSFDQATAGVRNTWPDSIRTVRIPPSTSATEPSRIDRETTGDDPIAAGLRLAEANALLHGASRLVRSVATASDSIWTRDGRVLILWPRAGDNAPERVDGIHAHGFTAIGHFVRLPSISDSGRVIARWLDGAAAARETALGAGCVRTIGFDVPDIGDFVLTPSFQRLLSVLAGPCGGEGTVGVASDSAIAAIAALSGATSARTPPDEYGTANRLAALLMAFAVLLAVTELWFRRRGTLPARAELST